MLVVMFLPLIGDRVAGDSRHGQGERRVGVDGRINRLLRDGRAARGNVDHAGRRGSVAGRVLRAIGQGVGASGVGVDCAGGGLTLTLPVQASSAVAPASV